MQIPEVTNINNYISLSWWMLFLLSVIPGIVAAILNWLVVSSLKRLVHKYMRSRINNKHEQ